MEQNRMAGFVVRRNLFLFVGNNAALFLRTDSNLNKRFLNIFLLHKRPVTHSRMNRSFIHQIFQISTGKSRSRLSDLLQINVFGQRFILGMYGKNFLPAPHIRRAHRYLSVKPAGTQDRRIQYIHTVSSRQHNNSFINAKSIHFHQQLVQRLLPFVMSASHTGTSPPCHRIDFIDKYNTGRMLLGIREQIPYSGSAHAYEHLYKIRTRNTEKRHIRFSCNGFCQKRFSGTRSAFQQDALWYSGSYFREFSRRFQKTDNFIQFFLFFLQTGHIA